MVSQLNLQKTPQTPRQIAARITFLEVQALMSEFDVATEVDDFMQIVLSFGSSGQAVSNIRGSARVYGGRSKTMNENGTLVH